MIEVCELTKQVRHDVFVRSPRRSGLTRVLTAMGATVLTEPDYGLSVTDMDACTIASAAADLPTFRNLENSSLNNSRP